MSDNRPPIKPNPPRWKPSSNPASIEVPGLDTSASVSDQIDQIEQLITLKLQVYSSLTSLAATNDTYPEHRRELFQDSHSFDEQNSTRRKALCGCHRACSRSSPGMSSTPRLNYYLLISHSSGHLSTSKPRKFGFRQPITLPCTNRPPKGRTPIPT